MLESNLSAPSGPSGASSPTLTDVPFCNTLDGSNAINSPATDDVPPKTASNADLDVSPGSSPASVGLFPKYLNSDTRAITGILDAFRQHTSKLEHSPCSFLHLKHREDGSEALYRVNACSKSRYFRQGRAQMIKNIRQRLSDGHMSGVFFTLTVDAKRYSLLEAWPAMWPQFNRFKDALNIYRKRNMNASKSFRYIAALEPHESDYPHLHVYCPELTWLIKRQDLAKMDEWWGMGSANTKKERRHDSAMSYVVKYISKLGGWSEVSMALVWHFKMRIYNLSHRKESYTGESESEWEWLASYRNAEDLSEGLGIGFRAAESLIDTWADVEGNLVYLT